MGHEKTDGVSSSAFFLIVLYTKATKALASLWLRAQWLVPRQLIRALGAQLLLAGQAYLGRKRVGPSAARGKARIVIGPTAVITMLHLR